MAKVITFSRQFPAYHPKKGQSTYFVEKIWKALGGVPSEYTLKFIEDDFKKSIVWGYQMVEGVKFHTIRAGNRWKAGDKFSPRVWSGKPYSSKMITIAPDIEIKKVWEFEMKKPADHKLIFIDGVQFDNYDDVSFLAKNDGLDMIELFNWFNKPFKGQIICWNENVNYL